MKENIQLINFRKSLDKTQDEMAYILEVSTSYYQKIESGERNPSFNFIKKFKNKFKNAELENIFFSCKPHGECSSSIA